MPRLERVADSQTGIWGRKSAEIGRGGRIPARSGVEIARICHVAGHRWGRLHHLVRFRRSCTSARVPSGPGDSLPAIPPVGKRPAGDGQDGEGAPRTRRNLPGAGGSLPENLHARTHAAGMRAAATLLRPRPGPAGPPHAGWMKSGMAGVDGSRSRWMAPGYSRHSGPFSRYSRTMDSDVIDWQGRQIVQSLLNLDDSLP